ncbi:MAG: MFS transporter [Actinomycetota bacterium]|nr:MFS transporter [Actinomycetota bacterium]
MDSTASAETVSKKTVDGRGVSIAPLLAIVYAAGFIAAFNENIINVALLELSEGLSVSTGSAQWLVTGYMVVTSVITASIGFLTRRFTTRRLFLASAASLIIGEAGCLVAPSFVLLLPLRLLQAVGSGIFLPLMMIVALAVAPRERTGLFISIGGACITLGPAFGPVLSGFMDTFFGWRGIFMIPLVVATMLMVLGLRFVRNVSETEQATLDPPSLVLMSAGLTAFVLGLNQVTVRPVVGAVLIVVSLVLIVAFIWRQTVLPDPMLDVHPLFNTVFWPASLLMVVAMMMTFSMSVLLPLYFEEAFGVGALAAGLLILPAIVLNAITSIVGGKMMDAHGPWPLLPVGFSLIAGGQALVAFMSPGRNMVVVVACSVLVYAGVGLVLSPSQTAGLRRLPLVQRGSGTAILNTLLMIAASVGSSLFVGLFSSRGAAASGSGMADEVAVAVGFSHAVWVATAIAAAGLLLALWYARGNRGTNTSA